MKNLFLKNVSWFSIMILTVLLILIVSCGWNSTNLISQKFKSYELYAPDSVNLAASAIQIDSAYARISRVLGETPPEVIFLLFPTNEDLMNYNYADLTDQKKHFLAWLTNEGLKSIMNKSDQAGGVTYTYTDTSTYTVTIDSSIFSKNYISLGVLLGNDDQTTEKRVVVQRSLNIFETIPFKDLETIPLDCLETILLDSLKTTPLRKGDIILRINDQRCETLTEFDRVYTGLLTAAPVELEVLREQEKLLIHFNKPAEKPQMVDDIETVDSNRTNFMKSEFEESFLSWILSHEAGHMFYFAFLDLKLNQYHLSPDLFKTINPAQFYGHPLIADWLDEAMAVACEPPKMRRERIMGLQANIHKVIDLAQFVTLEHPNILKNRADSTANKVDTAFFYQQSIALLQYLLEKEGAEFINSMSVNLVRGKKFIEVIPEAHHIPHDWAELNHDFRVWLSGY